MAWPRRVAGGIAFVEVVLNWSDLIATWVKKHFLDPFTLF